MIVTRLLSVWDGLVGSAALIGIIILALGVMIRAVKLEDVLRHLGAVIGIVIPLIMLPAIIVFLLGSMSWVERISLVMIVILTLTFLGVTKRKSRR